MSQSWRIIVGDSLAVLSSLPDASVDCCVTSPPYWGLRDYGVAGQMGLEATPDKFVAGMVGVFREVRRVLREDGTCWVNIGDSYAGSGPSGASYESETTKRRAEGSGTDGAFRVSKTLGERGLTYADKKPIPPSGFKHKDLIGIPWRLALALHADGWWLRQDIIWAKPNPMPESVTDRCTKSHEYIFMLTKSARYFYDAAAIAEPTAYPDDTRPANGSLSPGQREGSGVRKRVPPIGGVKAVGENGNGNRTYSGNMPEQRETRNARSVWKIPSQASSVPHFAMFPEELPRRCIKAGCPVGGVVLDPFSGMATTGQVAIELGRSYIGIELNPKYGEMSRDRLRGYSPLLATEAADAPVQGNRQGNKKGGVKR